MRRPHLTVNAVAYALFVPTGLITVMLGPLLPTFSARWSLNDTQAGYLVTAQFLGSLVGTLSSGFVVSRVAFRRTVILGVGLMALGAATIAADGYLCSVAAVFCYGGGIGLTVPTANLMVAQASAEQRSSSLNLLNFFWSAGAVACPFLLAALQRGQSIGIFLTVLVGFLVLLILTLTVAPVRIPDAAPQSSTSTQVQLRGFRTMIALVFGALFFLYVGTETALGAWIASFAKRVTSGTGTGWITIPAYFYGALLAGRLAASWTLKWISDVTQSRIGIVLAVGSVAGLLFTRTLVGVAISATLVGLGLSTLYPIAIGFASAALGSAASRLMGTLFACSTLGAASIPWLVGYTSTRFGSLRIALLVPLAGCLAIAVLFWNPLVGKYRCS